MKKSILNFAAFALCASIAFTSCRKDKSDPIDDGSAIAHAGDEASVNEESDQVSDDAGAVMETSMSGARGSERLGKSLCGATSVDISLDNKTATITYSNSLSCDQKRYRTGVVTVTLSADKQWKDMGAVLTITTSGLVINRIKDGKTITIKGTHIITNVSGGLVSDLLTSNTPIVHDIKAVAMSVTLEKNGSVRTWDAHRKRTFSKTKDGLEVKIEGADAGGVAATGINRKGDAFTTTIIEPLVANSCTGTSTDAKWNVLSGVKSHSVAGKTITVGYGYDASNNKIATCDANTIKINYEGPKGSLEKFYTYK